MKILCLKDNLVQGTQIAQRCISSRAPLPILNGILLTANNNSLIFQATDLDLAIECSLPAEVISEGSVVVPARHFSDIVRRLPNQNITLEYNSDTRLLILTYASAKFSINTFNSEEFPVLPTLPEYSNLEISQKMLKKIIQKITFAASTDPIRPIFTGVFMEISNDYLLFVATDTHRLAKIKIININTDIEKAFHTIVPAKALNELNRLITDEDKPLKISINANNIFFYTDEFFFCTKPIQGLYPDHQKVLPTNFQNKLSVNIADILPAIERASLLISTKDGNSIVHFTIKEDKLIINSVSANLGSVHEEIPILNEGQDLNISFNTQYFLEILKIIDAPQIIINFTGNLSPCVIKPVDEEDYLYLLLPVRN
jgi:DNA polymerase-3 subunit beta